LRAGIEGAIHAMNELFENHQDQPTGWGILLVDATNAFNSLNCAAMLLHVHALWLHCAHIFFLTHIKAVCVGLKGSTTLLYSKEGDTQGDLLSMFMYAIETLPLIRSLHNPICWTQLWYADDAFAGGSLSDLHEWFSLLCSCGPAFGYFPEPTKNFVVVSERFMGEVEAVFGGFGVHVVTGHRFLGGFIGSLSARDDFVLCKVHRWDGHITVLADVALTQPQLAYTVLVHSCSMSGLFYYVSSLIVVPFLVNWRDCLLLIFCQPFLVWKCLLLNVIC